MIRDMALAIIFALSAIFCAELIVIGFISLGPWRHAPLLLKPALEHSEFIQKSGP